MHVVIRRDEKLSLTVEDLASSNGSWLNGVRLQPYVPNILRSGDILRLGQIEIVFTAGESARLGN
jgi:pSer/pThr/pTyr-binding forkhead associated (FHA) protein